MENETIFEIIQDFTFLYFLVSTESETDDAELRSLLDSVNGFFVSIFSHELMNSKFLNKGDFDKRYLKVIGLIRNAFLKNSPQPNGKLMNELKNSTGVDFEHFTFDNVVIVDKKHSNDLICTNFSDFVIRKYSRDYADLFRQLLEIPEAVVDSFFKGVYSGLEIDDFELNNEIKSLSKRITDNFHEKFLFKRYPYSTALIFNKSKLTDAEKYFILYRYNLVKFALIIKELQPVSIKISGTVSINTDITYRKIKALVIETIYNDMKNMDSQKLSIIKKIYARLSKNIKNNSFFSINRKLRNNIHYKKREKISENELALLDEYQDVYLNTVLNVFNENISVSINRRYKFREWMTEKIDCNFREKAKKSGYKFMKFKDIFKDNY